MTNPSGTELTDAAEHHRRGAGSSNLTRMDGDAEAKMADARKERCVLPRKFHFQYLGGSVRWEQFDNRACLWEGEMGAGKSMMSYFGGAEPSLVIGQIHITEVRGTVENKV